MAVYNQYCWLLVSEHCDQKWPKPLLSYQTGMTVVSYRSSFDENPVIRPPLGVSLWFFVRLAVLFTVRFGHVSRNLVAFQWRDVSTRLLFSTTPPFVRVSRNGGRPRTFSLPVNGILLHGQRKRRDTTFRASRQSCGFVARFEDALLYVKMLIKKRSIFEPGCRIRRRNGIDNEVEAVTEKTIPSTVPNRPYYVRRTRYDAVTMDAVGLPTIDAAEPFVRVLP